MLVGGLFRAAAPSDIQPEGVLLFWRSIVQAVFSVVVLLGLSVRFCGSAARIARKRAIGRASALMGRASAPHHP